ncbi:hypothetical protein HNQ93_003176 [Hymenobacter luteus]|uniref:Glycosyltransferase RgtA/B/C/D-like domain-containing protein n=2 Tax=Hymenobacter TaxID=89966 RepID=A0A7W9T2J0_9BACT|nr:MULTISPECIES: hypothetical protein [Hymenobacter]MBB4602419.1 hypothetical protein [Hymenobacter latericoloratus]MBB6060310.1 hypothetical protein [Hymenobacter luteus]
MPAFFATAPSSAGVAALLLRGGQWLRRHHVALLALGWLVAQAISWHVNRSPRIYGDSVHYLAYAHQIAEQGNFVKVHYTRYLGYPLFLSAFLKLGLGKTAMALGQYVLAGLGAVAFYRAVRRLAHGAWEPAFLATLLYIGWAEIQRFNAFLLTESLFTSLLLLSLWAVGRARTAAGWGLALLVLLATVSIRPNGFVALAAAAVAGAVWVRQRASCRVQWGVLIGGVLLLPLAWVALNQLLLTFRLIKTYQEGMVIFMYDGILMQPPGALALPPPAASPVGRLAYFIGHNPRYFGQLAVWKLTFFMGFPKPYFSAFHALAQLLTLPPLYWLALRGLAARWVARPIRVFLAAAFLLQAAIVALTVEDYDVRFSGPVLPYLFVLAALGLTPWIYRLQHRLHRAALPPPA